MFTGIIQAVGRISHLAEGKGGDARITIAAAGLDLSDVALGHSIAANGVCLTVVEKGPDHYSVHVSAETLSSAAARSSRRRDSHSAWPRA